MFEQKNRKRLIGIVIGDKMQKTRRVLIERFVKHPLYEKRLHRSTTVYVHDEKDESHIGDKVEIIATRPLSKLKRWRLVKIIEKG